MTSYKRNILETIIYITCIIIVINLWHERKFFDFLSDIRFLNVLATSAITLSGIGVGLLGIMLALPETPGTRGKFLTNIKRWLLSLLKRSTIYFLLSSSFAFLCYAIPADFSSMLVVFSTLSTILFASGLLHMFYVCLNIDKALFKHREAKQYKV